MPDIPAVRHQIPALTLHSLSGRTVTAWDYKQKRNRVIIIVHEAQPAARDYVREIAAHAADWKEKEAVALIVFPAAPSTDLLHNPAPEIIAGVDASGRSIRRYLGEDAFGPSGLERQGVFVADRYGELYARWVVGNDGAFPSPRAILKALEQIEIACEECQTALWPIER